MHFELELFLEAGRRDSNARVHLDGEWRGITLPVCGEPRSVGTGQSGGAEWVPRSVTRNGSDGIVVANGIGRGIMQIPNPAVHAGVGRQRAKRPKPIKRNELLLEIRFGNRSVVVARK